jgi:stringent starvation protein A
MVISNSKRSVMTLFSGPDDVYSHRVRIILAEKGVTVDIVDVDKPDSRAYEELAEYNPYGTLPTLVDRDLVLYQSEIIMEYLDERFPYPPLMPIYPVARGRSRLMMHRINLDWYAHMDQILKSTVSSEQEHARKSLLDSITTVTPVFSEMPFFLSEEFSLVDCCIATLLWRLPVLNIELPEPAKPILEYAEKIFERPSFQASLTDLERTMRMK